MKQIDAQVLYRPSSAEQRFLPEGPYRNGSHHLSWVSIQHGIDTPHGSLNLFDLRTNTNRNFPLGGRPGFAFPTDRDGVFVVGVERSIVLFDCHSRQSNIIVDGIDRQTSNTIINDGVVFEGHLIFGCKDLEFAHRKAGLYLLPAGSRTPVRLRDDQICSNGKEVVVEADGRLTLYDIDSPTQQVIAWQLDLQRGRLTDRRIVVDLTSTEVYPDGMVLTPDRQGIIVALYDPRASEHGEAHLYDLRTGQCQIVWRCAKSPRVTCPQLVRRSGRIELVLTTADEGMSPEHRTICSEAGSLFIADTDFDQLNPNPVFPIG